MKTAIIANALLFLSLGALFFAPAIGCYGRRIQRCDHDKKGVSQKATKEMRRGVFLAVMRR